MAKLRSMKGKGVCGGSIKYPNPLHPATSTIEDQSFRFKNKKSKYANLVHPPTSSIENYPKSEKTEPEKVGKKSGMGVIKETKKAFVKGSKEAKDFMAKLRSMKK
jgi:hypothetical protein